MERFFRRIIRVFCGSIILGFILWGGLAQSDASLPKLTEEVYALAPSGILNNGLGGITIDINTSPYTGTWAYGAPYGQGGCTWFVGARVMELTGKGERATHSGENWYNWYGASLGFSKGQDIQEGAVLCWSGHVAFVEKIEGSTVYISEGGCVSYYAGNNTTIYPGAEHGYCVIRTVSINAVKGLNSGFYGCIYTGATDTHTPKGWVDDCSLNSNGTIHVEGWAFDKDDLNQYCEIRVYVGEDECHVLGKANTYRPDVNNVHSCGNYHGYKFDFSTGKSGTQTVYIHACNIAGTQGMNRMIKSYILNIPSDTVKPTVSNVQASNYTSTGFTVTYNVSDNTGVTRASVPVWNAADPDSSQAYWFPATISGGKATAQIKYASIPGGTTASQFNVHAYAWDAAGNFGVAALSGGAAKDVTPPTISNVSVENLSVSGFDIKCKVQDASGVDRVEVESYWYNDKDDGYKITESAVLSGGYYTFHRNAPKAGNYRNIIYAYDRYGNRATYITSPSGLVTVPADMEEPVLENLTYSYGSGIFTIEFDAYDQGEGELTSGWLWFTDANVGTNGHVGNLLRKFNYLENGTLTTTGQYNFAIYCTKNERIGNHFSMSFRAPECWNNYEEDPGFPGWHGFSLWIKDSQGNGPNIIKKDALYIEPDEKIYHKVGEQVTWDIRSGSSPEYYDGVVVTNYDFDQFSSEVKFTPETIGTGYLRTDSQTSKYESYYFTAYDDLSNCDITLSNDAWHYDAGDEELPVVTVKYGDQVLEEGVNYTVDYQIEEVDGESGEIPEQGEIIITGIKDGYLDGTIRKAFAIESEQGCDHANTVTAITKATTSADGSIVTKCRKDGTVLMEETIPQIGEGTLYYYCNDSYSVLVKDSAGEVIDSNQYVAVKSGNKILVTFNSTYYDGMLSLDIPAEKIHEWGEEYTVDREATTEEEGCKSIHCRKCDTVQEGSEIVIPKLNGDDPSGGGTQTVTSVVILGEPDKTEYIVGETFDPAGLLVGKRYENQEVDAADASEYRLSSPNMNKIGEQTVYVTLYGKVAYFSITIKDKTAVSMQVTEPAKTIYHRGDVFDPSGMKVMVTYDNGKTEEVKDYQISGFIDEPGTQLITVSYGALDDYIFFIEMHEIGDWTVTKEATYDAEGLKERTCSICGEKMTEVIPKLVKNADQQKAERVVAMINALPPAASASNEAAVKAARNAYNSLTAEQKKLVSSAILSKLTAAETQVAKAKEAAAKAAVPAVGSSQIVSGQTYVVLSKNTVAFAKALNKKSVTVPAAIAIKGITYQVTQINARAFEGSKIRTVTVDKNVAVIKSGAFSGSKATKVILKTKKLTKKSIKNSLKKSKVKTVKVKSDKSCLKKYKKIFVKKVVGKKVSLK